MSLIIPHPCRAGDRAILEVALRGRASCHILVDTEGALPCTPSRKLSPANLTSPSLLLLPYFRLLNHYNNLTSKWSSWSLLSLLLPTAHRTLLLCCAPPCLCPTSSPSTPSACVSSQIIDFLLGPDGSFPMLLQAGLSNALTPRPCACLCGAHLIISRTLCVLSHCHANSVQAQTVSCYPFASPQGPAKDWLMVSAQEAESHCRKLP